MKLILLAVIFLCIACSSDRKEVGTATMKMETGKDSCYSLTDSARRTIKIVENKLADTVLLGLAVLAPGYTGSFVYSKFGTATDMAMYSRTPVELMPKTEMFCIDLYQRRPAAGYIVIQYTK